ncbi:CbtA family protein [Nocardioides panacisoli]|uniref:CbtA family protein n=1 Tax=Nocardioides panacisoli TaxID=627624 RepID=UPI001C6335FD|nr:CbtA family protein [Nocardioides panacisoli]QYJ05475.1 CbtA family protein [Nocardioides panacisoli]
MTQHVPQENSARTGSATRSTLRPVDFLVRGLAAGLVAGLFAFLVGFAVGEPAIDDAIAVEEAAAAAEPAPAEEADPADAGGTEVSRGTQKSWGLLTGLVLVGPALGGLTGLAAAAAMGRLGSISARGSTALVTLVGFVTVALVPFWKYPSTPPAVGAAETMDSRTVYYFGFLVLSVLAGIAAVVVAPRLVGTLGGYGAAAAVVAGYLAVMTVAGLAMPAVNEVGDFPADTLWEFRTSSLLTLAALWAALGVTLVALVGRLHDRAGRDAERRALAASL